ncbi:GxxExxY protein [Taibaiella lutea]|nr:GxxExxY protein [Taibaiella lutea]
MVTKKYLDELTYSVIGAAIEVHKTMGRGLLESIYHQCLIVELRQRNINFQTELLIPFKYKETPINLNLRCDLFIEKCLVVELKSVGEMSNIFEAQLLSYMKLLQSPKGILINFNCANIFKDGQKTFVNQYYNQLLDL